MKGMIGFCRPSLFGRLAGPSGVCVCVNETLFKHVFELFTVTLFEATGTLTHAHTGRENEAQQTVTIAQNAKTQSNTTLFLSDTESVCVRQKGTSSILLQCKIYGCVLD